MKLSLITTPAIICLGMFTSLAANAYTYKDKHGHRYSCYNEQVTSSTQTEDHTTAGTLAGGAIGGLAGNQFGKGSGNAAATAAYFKSFDLITQRIGCGF